MPSKPKYKEAQTPQVSANQLSQYLLAGPSARKRIVQAARWQSTAVVARYRLAREAIVSCLCDDTRCHSTVAKHRAEMTNKLGKSSSSWTNDDLESSILALDRYAAAAGQTILSKLTCTPLIGSVPPLEISGLRVKVTPSVLLKQSAGAGSPDRTGAMIAIIAKGEKSGNARKEQARTASILVWQFAQKHLAKSGEPERALCLAYDVFEGTVTPPSANYASRLQNIRDACEEILDKWYKATPPEDFDG